MKSRQSGNRKNEIDRHPTVKDRWRYKSKGSGQGLRIGVRVKVFSCGKGLCQTAMPCHAMQNWFRPGFKQKKGNAMRVVVGGKAHLQ